MLISSLESYEKEPLSIPEKEYRLREAFNEIAFVDNFDKKYVSAPFVNQLIDPELQGYAADMIVYDIVEKIKNEKIDIIRRDNKPPVFKVVGIPDSGLYLATAVAERLGWKLAPGRKGPNPPPGAWKDQFIIEEKVRSYTTGAMSSFAFNGIDPLEDNLLVIDDVAALGYTSNLVIEEFLKRGINVIGLGVYFDKMGQGGIQNIEENTDVNTFSSLRIEEIYPNSLQLSIPHFYTEDSPTPTP
jgi:adenine/guanine phosphoribosyltransferase-like PRPP-binding protein